MQVPELETLANPGNLLRETNNANNIGRIKIQIGPTSVTIVP